MKFSTFALALTFVSFSSIAATTGNLTLQGIVPDSLEIIVTAEAVASTLPLQTTQTNLKVAEVTEISNNADGYNVTISGAGELTRVGGTETIAYSLTYGGQAVTLGDAIDYEDIQNDGSVAVDVGIAYTGVPHLERVAGTYSDTVTFSIAAN